MLWICYLVVGIIHKTPLNCILRGYLIRPFLTLPQRIRHIVSILHPELMVKHATNHLHLLHHQILEFPLLQMAMSSWRPLWAIYELGLHFPSQASCKLHLPLLPLTVEYCLRNGLPKSLVYPISYPNRHLFVTHLVFCLPCQWQSKVHRLIFQPPEDHHHCLLAAILDQEKQRHGIGPLQ